MKPFDVDTLLQDAREKTGLSDFGPPDFLEALHVLVDSLNAQGEIDDGRRNDLHEHFFLRLLTNRLWFAKDLADHPEILDEVIEAPVVIASLPRTGSTKLHRMLGASGDFQTVTLWRGHRFARIPGQPDGGVAQRIRDTEAFEQWVYATSPKMLTGHPMFTHEAEEDFTLLDASFRYPSISATLHVPDYARWLASADMRPTYDYFLAQLKYLQWQAKPLSSQSPGRPKIDLAPSGGGAGRRTGPGAQPSGKPWLLKAPNHFGTERELMRIFGKPRFLITHRDPARCLPSLTTTVMAFRQLYSDDNTRVVFGREMTDFFAATARQHMDWCEAEPGIRVLDLRFRDIDEDGPRAAQQVYDFLDMPLTPQAEAAMREWERVNRKDRHGISQYSAAMMETTEDQIRGAFKPYIDRYAAYIQ